MGIRGRVRSSIEYLFHGIWFGPSFVFALNAMTVLSVDCSPCFWIRPLGNPFCCLFSLFSLQSAIFSANLANDLNLMREKNETTISSYSFRVWFIFPSPSSLLFPIFQYHYCCCCCTDHNDHLWWFFWIQSLHYLSTDWGMIAGKKREAWSRWWRGIAVRLSTPLSSHRNGQESGGQPA